MSLAVGSPPQRPVPASSVLTGLLAGGVSAAISTTAGAPIERVKLLLQSQGEMIKQGRLEPRYTGISDVMVRIYKSEGLRSFWRGNLAPVIRYFPEHAVTFACKNQFRALFKIRREAPFWKNLCTSIAAGAAASTTSLLFVYSLVYAQTRLATDVVGGGGEGRRQFDGLVDVYRKTLASDGIIGLYRGFVPSVVAIAVYRGLHFGLYDGIRPVLITDPLRSAFVPQFALAWTVTLVAGTFSYPLDTIRRRMMMTSCTGLHYPGMLVAAQQIVVREGSKALFAGYSVQLLKSVFGAAMVYGVDVMSASR